MVGRNNHVLLGILAIERRKEVIISVGQKMAVLFIPRNLFHHAQRIHRGQLIRIEFIAKGPDASHVEAVLDLRGAKRLAVRAGRNMGPNRRLGIPHERPFLNPHPFMRLRVVATPEGRHKAKHA